MPPKRFNKYSVGLLKTVLERNHLLSISDDDSNSEFEEILIQNDCGVEEDEEDPEDKPLERPLVYYQLQNRLLSLINRQSDRNPLPTLEELQTTYAELSNDDLTRVINVCSQFLCLSATVSILKLQEASSTENVSKVQGLSKKWEGCKKPSLKGKSIEWMRQLLVSAFNDMETFVDIVEQAKG